MLKVANIVGTLACGFALTVGISACGGSKQNSSSDQQSETMSAEALDDVGGYWTGAVGSKSIDELFFNENNGKLRGNIALDSGEFDRISGSVNGLIVIFTRNVTQANCTQVWKGRLSTSEDIITGNFTGCGGPGSFWLRRQ